MTDMLERLTAALADRYTIDRQIGQGGMATVFLAHDVRHNRNVAVKVLRPELSAILGGERFLKEIEVTANLQHPNILPLYDSGEADSFLYYVMPFIEGESLRDRLNREKQLGVEDAVEIARGVAGALDFAHQRGVIHRDIKPENILLQAGQALVADFGIALALSAAGGGTRLTETGLSVGTPHYMSPEQASADRELDGRTDIYSLGAMLYEMLVGQPPFIAPSAQAIVAKILTETPPPAGRDRSAVPPHVDAAIQMSMAKLPADRFGSAAAFSAALVNPSFTLATTAVAPGLAAPAATRRPVQWAVAAGMVVVGLAAGFVLRGSPPAPDVVRFELTLTDGQRLGRSTDEDVPLAVSPDGRLIVYVGVDSGRAERQLFARALDRTAGVPIPGTEDAASPFFSPDGLWIAFTTDEDDRLKKVPVTGGPPITIADDVNDGFAGGSWGDDGFIVYNSSGFNLSRVSGAGGVPEVLVDVEGGAAFWPSVLPGGEAVLFERCEAGCGRTDLAVVDVVTKEVTVVVPGATRGWYVPTGHLLYATEEGAVYGVAFDAGRRVVTGSPVPLLEGVADGQANALRLAIGASGAMAYLPGSASSGNRLVEVDRSGRETVILERPGQYAHPRWSPSGDRVALTIGGESGSQIWLYDRGSETLSQLTFEGVSFRPTWSPDGSRIAFYSNREDAWDLYTKPADGSGTAQRVGDGRDTENGGTTFWTRDGEWIVVDGTADVEDGAAADGDEDVFAINAETGERREAVATDAEEETGAVSPDGRWIAHGSDESGTWQVYVRPFLEEGGRWLVSTGPAMTPLWASNTELVYYDVATSSLISAQLEIGTSVRVLRREQLVDWSPYARSSSSPQYDISRDGQRIVALRTTGRGEIAAPIVVLNWHREILRRMEAQGGG
jgi:serine/threonine-protein kinase